MGFTSLGLGGSTVFNPGVTYTFTAVENFAAGIVVQGGISFPGSGPDAHDSLIDASPSGNVILQGQEFTFQTEGGSGAPIACRNIDLSDGSQSAIVMDGGQITIGVDSALTDGLSLRSNAGIAFGNVDSTGHSDIFNNGQRILQAQQPAIADATAPTLLATVNAILHAMRESTGHGLIGG